MLNLRLELLEENQVSALLDLLEDDYSVENREEVLKIHMVALNNGGWANRVELNLISGKVMAMVLDVEYDYYLEKAEFYEDLTDYLDNDWSDKNKTELLSEHLYMREVGLEWKEFRTFNSYSSEELMEELNLRESDLPENYSVVYTDGKAKITKSKVDIYLYNQRKKEKESGNMSGKLERNSDIVSEILPIDYEAIIRYAFNTKDYEWLEELIRESYANKTFKEIFEYAVENENYELAAYIKKNYTEWID